MTAEAFSKVLIDIVGPLPMTSQGDECLLTTMCVTTRFLSDSAEKMAIPVITKMLLKYFTMTGLPQDV